jgi:hypothetical protein
MTASPETSASLHGRRAGFQSALNTALLAGHPTQKLRQQIADIDRELAARAHADAIAAEAAQRAADERIEVAATAIADAIDERREALLAAVALPGEAEPMDVDGTILAAAAALERATAELTEANTTFDTARLVADRISGQLAALKETRDTIVNRRSAGDHREGDAGQLALIQADTEGLQPLATEANASLGVARKGVTDRTAARQHAVTELSTAEDRVLLAALVERARAADTVMLDLVTRISTVAKRQHRELPWVASHELRTKLYLDAVQNPRLAEAGRPGSKWPALCSA